MGIRHILLKVNLNVNECINRIKEIDEINITYQKDITTDNILIVAYKRFFRQLGIPIVLNILLNKLSENETIISNVQNNHNYDKYLNDFNSSNSMQSQFLKIFEDVIISKEIEDILSVY